MTQYDLTTARGVLLALADGHELTNSAGAKLHATHTSLLVDVRADSVDLPIVIALTRNGYVDGSWEGRQVWDLRPKDIDAMGLQELARELYGSGAVVTTGVEGVRAFVYRSMLGPHEIFGDTRDALLKQLRVLVRAKRAGEL